MSLPAGDLSQRLRGHARRLSEGTPLLACGRLRRVVGLTLEVVGCQVPVGGRCLVGAHDGDYVEAEIVGFDGERSFLMPVGDLRGVRPGARVVPQHRSYEAPLGDELLGRVIDGAGEPLDGLGPLKCGRHAPLFGTTINPLARQSIRRPLDVGVRAINALLTIGRGQRIGLFAGSGVGKSVLLGMMTRFTEADVVVVGLIGERGREVKDFVEQTLGDEGLQQAVVVASPADTSPVNRMHGAWLATRIAEDFRDQGRHVLLLMDSLTRFAQAQREIALAIGEPPATRGYTPSVFTKLSQLVERAGNASGDGSLTALYTVLAEGDDQNDPVADASRAILDGHIVLSRRIAESNLYPAIDLEASISRAMHAIVTDEHLQSARVFGRVNAAYEQQRDLINIGAYEAGSDPRVDEAIMRRSAMEAFRQQDMDRPVRFDESVAQLAGLFEERTNEAVP